MKVYSDYKDLCGKGDQPGSFKSYCESLELSPSALYMFLSRKHLSIKGLPGYGYKYACTVRRQYQEVPFEEVIFEESGFLPSGNANVITIGCDGHLCVSFPADTDLDVVAKFVRKLRKEAGNVGS